MMSPHVLIFFSFLNNHLSKAVVLIPWFIKEVAPHYPGLCGAAYIVNYSWAYGMYNIVK